MYMEHRTSNSDRSLQLTLFFTTICTILLALCKLQQIWKLPSLRIILSELLDQNYSIRCQTPKLVYVNVMGS